MDFNRSTQSQAVAPGAHPAPAPASSPVNSGNKKSKGKFDMSNWGRITAVVMVGAVALLLIALVTFLSVGGTTEDKYVDTNKLQAVFLNTGQVYFGNIKALNKQYFVLTNIYYLQTSTSGSSTSSSNASTSVSLVKLGCELHEPYDQMVINAGQVTFWENLQSNGQVAQAVAKFEKAHPKGQQCADQSTSSSTSSTNNVQNAPTTGSSSSNTASKP